MNETTSPVLDEMREEQQRDWKDEQKEKWFDLRTAFQGLMLGRMQRQQLAAEAVDRHARKQAGVEEGQPETEGDMSGVSIGNKVFNHYEAPKQEAQAKSDLLKKALVGAALVAGGGGVGLLASQLIAPAVDGVVDTDTDTISVIDFPD